MIDCAPALNATLRAFPFAVNSSSTHTSESLLSIAAGRKPTRVLGELLRARCMLGLVPNQYGETAVSAALKRDAKSLLRVLLRMCARMTSAHPFALEPVMQHRVEIASKCVRRVARAAPSHVAGPSSSSRA
jgi:hypothetical protein